VIALKMAMDAEPSLRDVIPVGTFGKHLSSGDSRSQQAKFMRLRDRGVEEVTIMWDGEVRATDDACEAAKVLNAVGLRVRIAMLPKDSDPNEVPKEVVQKAFYEAIPFSASKAAAIMLRRRHLNR
jgi:DNA primase